MEPERLNKTKTSRHHLFRSKRHAAVGLHFMTTYTGTHTSKPIKTHLSLVITLNNQNV